MCTGGCDATANFTEHYMRDIAMWSYLATAIYESRPHTHTHKRLKQDLYKYAGPKGDSKAGTEIGRLGYNCIKRERERETQTDRDSERERGRERETARERERERETETARERETERERERER